MPNSEKCKRTAVNVATSAGIVLAVAGVITLAVACSVATMGAGSPAFIAGAVVAIAGIVTAGTARAAGSEPTEEEREAFNSEFHAMARQAAEETAAAAGRMVTQQEIDELRDLSLYRV